MNALELLKQDHQKVKQLFEEATHASDQNKRKDLFDKIDTELEIHAHIEETVFSPCAGETRRAKRYGSRSPGRASGGQDVA